MICFTRTAFFLLEQMYLFASHPDRLTVRWLLQGLAGARRSGARLESSPDRAQTLTGLGLRGFNFTQQQGSDPALITMHTWLCFNCRQRAL